MPPETAPSGILSVAEIQQFLQSAVHDLRAANRRTNIAAELFLQTDYQEGRIELAAQISQGLAKSEEILAGIGKYGNALSLSKQATTSFPCASAVRFALNKLDQQIRETGATVHVGDLPEVKGDRDRLAEVFQQLISNSLKFRSADPPVVHISAEPIPGFWRISVTDNGQGIAPKYRDRLFMAFRRLHGPDIPGSGLGLVISRKIIEAHGGVVGIDDSETAGVRFSFTLPIDGAPRA
jgi:light-regulated signal transduction histidine kinase (bacteriophytochrome)